MVGSEWITRKAPLIFGSSRLTIPPERIRLVGSPKGLMLGPDEGKVEHRNVTC